MCMQRAPGFRPLLFVAIATLVALLGSTPAPAQELPVAQVPSPATFLNIVPTSDGSGLFVEAGSGQPVLNDTLVTSVQIGPGGNKNSFTMTLSETNQLYYASVVGFSPRSNETGTVELTSTLGLDSGLLNYTRYFLPDEALITLLSDDTRFEILIADREALPAESYLALTPSAAPPGLAPPGHQLVGLVYSARVPEPQPAVADPFFIVNMRYPTAGGPDPRSLAIFAWDAAGRRWSELPSRLLTPFGSLSAAATRFTSYALMARPGWSDSFDDATGLDPAGSVNLRVSLGALSQDDPLLGAQGRSQPITLPAGAARWDTLTFSATGSVRVDVLASDGSPLIVGATDGTSLAAIDPAVHPALQLQVELLPGAGPPPRLDSWRLAWRMAVGVSLAGLNRLYDGSPQAVEVVTDPPGLPTIVTYTGVEGTGYGPSTTPPTAVGTYRVRAEVDAPDVAGAAEGVLVIVLPITPDFTVYLPSVQR